MKKKKKKNKESQAIFTAVWIAFVSLFLFNVLDVSLQKMGSETFIKNSSSEKILKSESRNKVKYKIEDGQGNYKYSWTFDKTREVSDNFENVVNFSIDKDVINTKIEKLVTSMDKLVLTFYHHGDLPSKSEIEIDVSDNFNDGDKLYLYYYNEDDNSIEYVQDNILVKDGLADFNIDHCSEYILTKIKIPGSKNNPNKVKAVLFYIMIGVIIIFTLKSVFGKK